jgi:hypothetical protein
LYQQQQQQQQQFTAVAAETGLTRITEKVEMASTALADGI